jgi:phosphate transport system permease protein
MRIAGVNLKSLIAGQYRRERWFQLLAASAVVFALVALVIFLLDVFADGVPRLNWQFITSYPSRKPEQAGILSALVGSVYLVIVTAALAVPLGIGAAVYLEEYARDSFFTRLIEVNIANLAGVPSIIYGILGLELFVRFMVLERSLIAGALTMTLLILPIVILASREALRAVPRSLREASYALGATRWQTTRCHVLPLALPGMLTGIILALSRAIGETAPLIMLGALTYVAFLPTGLKSPFTALPIQIFNWVSRPQAEFAINAAAGIVVLLVILLSMNGIAIWLRNKYQRKYQW